MKRSKHAFDAEEQELIDSIEKGEWVSIPDEEFEKLKTNLQIAARNSKEERQMISIKLRKSDLSWLKIEAQEKGLPYQTLLNSIIHRYVMEN